jgi:acetyl-CoA carboxylase biotin carboxylase subunit
MGETAVALAKHAGYTNAGTAEFLVDAEENFYFLEMNTRLQVEHPVTELITGLDLVHLQLQIAAGDSLPFTQDDIHLRGHAIECRIYAEDPDNNFFPSPGLITGLSQPSGAGIREDCGIYDGWTVPLDYDPMLSKLVAYAPTRALAIERMRHALDDYFVGGIATNISLFQRILSDPDFQTARIDTSYLDRLLSVAPATQSVTDTVTYSVQIAAIAAALFSTSGGKPSEAGAIAQPADAAWKQAARREGLR